MKIKSIRLSRLRNAEHYQYHTEVNDLVAAATDESLNISTLFSVYQQHLKNEGTAMNLILKSEFTDDLNDADNERDSIFRGFYDLVKSGTNHFNPHIKAASERIMFILEDTGNLNAMPYNEQTAMTSALIDKLRTENVGDLAITNTLTWVDELSSKNNAFENLAKTRYTQEAGKTSLRMKEVRLGLDTIYRKMVQLINALILVNGEAGYTSFVSELNERIDKYNLILAQREGRNTKA